MGLLTSTTGRQSWNTYLHCSHCQLCMLFLSIKTLLINTEYFSVSVRLPFIFHQWLHPPNSLQDLPGQFCSQPFTLNTFIRISQQILMSKCWAKSKMNKTNPINFWQSYIVQLSTPLLIYWAILSLSIYLYQIKNTVLLSSSDSYFNEHWPNRTFLFLTSLHTGILTLIHTHK